MIEHAPRSVEGAIVWRILDALSLTVTRAGDRGVPVAVDLALGLGLARARGVDDAIAAILVPAAAAGLLAGLQERAAEE